MSNLQLRAAQPDDINTIMRFIQELADYEKEPDAVVATPEDLRKTLFCDTPKVFGLICERDNQAIGFAIYFYNYSTWLGKHGIYLEDLYVTPQARGSGGGKALLKELARIAVANDCGRVEWSVLDWNTPAIDFYLSVGAGAQDEWTVYRLTGEALQDFAEAD